MNRNIELILNFLRGHVYPTISNGKSMGRGVIMDPGLVKKIMIDFLSSDEPCMIARYGAFEGAVVLNYIGTINKDHTYIKYITSECEAWWWNQPLLQKLNNNAGFYPLELKYIERYCELMLKDSGELDVVGCFDNNSNAERLYTYHNNCKYVRLACIEPDFATKDASSEWTSCLKGKRVLVVHPFAETIRSQYQNRTVLFNDPDFLPDFELLTIKAVQSIGGNNLEFSTWFDALAYMESEMDKLDYDIAIIGCGAYGFNLAAHAKRTGHKAIHLGGSTQVLFGIRGKRWEERDDFRKIMNDNWVRPSDDDKPKSAQNVENGCYW